MHSLAVAVFKEQLFATCHGERGTNPYEAIVLRLQDSYFLILKPLSNLYSYWNAENVHSSIQEVFL